jgi:hypothetical protein
MSSNLFDKDRAFVKNMLTGKFVVTTYDRLGHVKNVRTARNVVTTAGLNRLVDMLVDGYDVLSPAADGDRTDASWQKSLLHRKEDFDGGVPGRRFGLDVADWPGRSKSTWEASTSSYSRGYFTGRDNMFNNDQYSATDYTPNYVTGGYWAGDTTDSMQYGHVMDMGLTGVSNELFSAANTSAYFNLANKNAKYGSMVLKNSSESTTYTLDTHYLWDTGDGQTYSSIKLIPGAGDALVGQTLKATYAWYDVPQVPIVGFCIDAGGSGDHDYRTFFNAFSWSMDQGKSRSWPFFPFRSGTPRGSTWKGAWNSWYWADAIHFAWGAHSHFITSLPWAVRNPVQMGWFGNRETQQKRVYDFELLTYRCPKPGIHAISLGDGSGVPSASDTALFNERIKNAVEMKGRSGDSLLKLRAWLDFDEGNGITFREMGLHFPSSDDVYFKRDPYWNNSAANGGAGVHDAYISGTYNGIEVMSPIVASDCDTLAAHAMFDTPWTKNSDERQELSYELTVNWS